MNAKKMIGVVEPLVVKWREILGLSRWQITIGIHRENGARIEVDYRYLRARMSISQDTKEDEIEAYILHELLHILTGEIVEEVTKIKERFSPTELLRIMTAEDKAVESITRTMLYIEKASWEET